PFRPRAVRRGHDPRGLHLGQRGRRHDPARRAAARHRPHGGVGAADHDAGRRFGAVHLFHRRAPDDRAAALTEPPCYLMRCTVMTRAERWPLRAGAAALAMAGLAAARPARADDAGATLVDHPDAPWWLSGQLNAIGQAQPGFHAPYTGDNSFRPDSHGAVS